MNISETKNKDIIYSIFSDPEIYDRISDDGSPPLSEFCIIDPNNSIHYLTDEDNIGLVFLHWKNSVTLEAHIQILKDHRDKSWEFGEKTLEWIWNNTEAKKIVVTIPDLYKDVIGFVEKHGFKREGLSSKSYMKNGVLFDQLYLGLSR